MKKNISKTLENVDKTTNIVNESAYADVGISLKNGSLLNNSNDLLFHLDKKTVDTYSATPTQPTTLNWESLNINLDTKHFNEKRDEILTKIANSNAVITQKLYAEFCYAYKTKIEFICNNVNSALMAQNLFTTPTPLELANFGVEDYSILVDIAINENSTAKNTIDVNIVTREILIQGEQALDKMGYGIFYVLNRLMNF